SLDLLLVGRGRRGSWSLSSPSCSRRQAESDEPHEKHTDRQDRALGLKPAVKHGLRPALFLRCRWGRCRNLTEVGCQHAIRPHRFAGMKLERSHASPFRGTQRKTGNTDNALFVSQAVEEGKQPIESAVESHVERHLRVNVLRRHGLRNKSADIHLGGSPVFKHHPHEIIRGLLFRDNRTQRVKLLAQLRNSIQVLFPLLLENLVELVFCRKPVYLISQAIPLIFERKDVEVENSACQKHCDQHKYRNLYSRRKIIEALGHRDYTLRLHSWPPRGSCCARSRASLRRGSCRRRRLICAVHIELVAY